MDSLQESKQILINETERKPNLYAARVLFGIVAVIAIVWMLNEVGVFQVDKCLMRICMCASLLQYAFMWIIARNKRWIVHPSVKYLYMASVLSLVFILSVLMNIHAVLAYVLPILLATQYRSFSMSRIAIFFSCLVCAVAPILSFFFGTWNLNFLTGYIETFCHVTIAVTPGNTISTLDAIWSIALYWSMPQVLSLAAFGLILFSVTKSGMESVHNQMQVSDLSRDLSRQLTSIVSMQEKVLYSMSDIIESRDTDTGGHVRRTSEIVRLIIGAMQKDRNSGVDDVFCASVIKCAPMHDLGKISIPDTILKKPDNLTDEEYEVVKGHPMKSAEIILQALTGIENEQLLSVATNIAKYHHERYDGTGYPSRLKGEEIPLEARIMAIADVYDALVSKRCYKEPMSCEEAFDTIERAMGTQFNPGLNKYFISCKDSIAKFYTSQQEK